MNKTAMPLLAAGAVLASALVAAPSSASACGGGAKWEAKRASCAYDKGSTSCCAAMALPPPATRLFGIAPQIGILRNPGDGTAAAFGLTFSSPAAYIPGTKLGASLRLSGLATTRGDELQTVVDARVGYLGWGSLALLAGGGVSYSDHTVPAPKGGMTTIRTGAAVVRTGLEVGLFGKITLEVPFDIHLIPSKNPGAPTRVDWDTKILLGYRFSI